jgi:hypothetical protein
MSEKVCNFNILKKSYVFGRIILTNDLDKSVYVNWFFNELINSSGCFQEVMASHLAKFKAA